MIGRVICGGNDSASSGGCQSLAVWRPVVVIESFVAIITERDAHDFGKLFRRFAGFEDEAEDGSTTPEAGIVPHATILASSSMPKPVWLKYSSEAKRGCSGLRC